MKQAIDVMCSGVTNFVYAIDTNTDVLYATRSMEDTPNTWSFYEQSLLQLSEVNISSQFFSEVAVSSAQSNTRKAEVFAEFSEIKNQAIENVVIVSDKDILESTREISCSDANDSATDVVLAYKNKSETAARNDMKTKCNQIAQNSVRALCPATCGCDSPYPSASGIFQSTGWGCPEDCLVWQMVAHSNTPCSDAAFDQVSTESWEMYVFSLRTYLLKHGFKNHITTILEEYQLYENMTENQKNEEKLFFTNRGFWSELKNYNYLIADGVPHPKGLVGCDFLASSELKVILTIELCSPNSNGEFMSLHMLCPVACNCVSDPTDCPAKCQNVTDILETGAP